MAGLTKALVFSVFLGALMACEGAAHKLGPLSHVVVEKADDTVELTLSVEADLLFVVDGSGSMANHQKRVMENLKLFLDELGRAQYLNYRVGVTIAGCARSTRFRQYQARTCYEGVLHSEAGGPGPYYVDRSDPGALEKLQRLLNVGTSHDARETFFGPVLKALTPPILTEPSNQGFLREGAHFVPIFITDTDDQTRDGNDLMSVHDFYSDLVAIIGQRGLILPYSVHIPADLGNTPDDCRRDPTSIQGGAPVRIEEFLMLARGTYFNICSPSLGHELVSIAKDIVGRIEPVIFLNDRPYPPSIRLSVDGEEIPNDFVEGWAYDPVRNAIVLGPEVKMDEAASNAVRVTYTKSNTF